MTGSRLLSVECQNCFIEYGQFHKKDVPKSFVCPHCKTGQTSSRPNFVGRSNGRNYPEGYFNPKQRY